MRLICDAADGGASYDPGVGMESKDQDVGTPKRRWLPLGVVFGVAVVVIAALALLRRPSTHYEVVALEPRPTSLVELIGYPDARERPVEVEGFCATVRDTSMLYLSSEDHRFGLRSRGLYLTFREGGLAVGCAGGPVSIVGEFRHSEGTPWSGRIDVWELVPLGPTPPTDSAS